MITIEIRVQQRQIRAKLAVENIFDKRLHFLDDHVITVNVELHLEDALTCGRLNVK
jgi:hypothetical protein